MKTIKFSTLLLVLSMLLFASCVKDDDFNLPDVSIKVPAFDGKVVSLAEAVSKSSDKVQTYTNNEAIEGYVISSDQGGNYYKKIYIQTLDGEDGFSVAINKAGLYAEYPLGTKVQVRLKDMSTQLVNGKLEVGYGVYEETKVGQMTDAVYKKSVINTGESVEIASIAHVVTSLKDLDKEAFINRLIIVKNVAFETSVVGKPYHQKENDKVFGSNYTLLDKTGGTLTFRTSKFAKYKDKLVPKEILNITGIVTKYKKFYQFMVNRYEDIEILEGTNGADIANGSGGNDNFKPKTVTELNETFDAVEAKKDINLEGWFSKATKGKRQWQGKEFKGNKFISTSAYKSKLDEMEAWVVTPGLDLSKAEHKNFTFESQTGYSKNETLEVFITSDFDYKKGIEAANWTKLDVKLAEKNAKGYSKFVSAGDIDLSAYSGVVYIGFKYTGNDKDASGTWNVDNVKFNYVPENNGGDDMKIVTELNETFDGVESNKDINLDGWSVVKEKGNRNWIGKKLKNGDAFAQISGYGYKGGDDIVAWLVTPGLDVSKATNKNITFDSKTGYSKEETLDVLISTDFKGDVTKATWQKLEGVTLAEKTPGGYGKAFVNAGNVDLSSYSGVVYVAFKYSGNGTDKTGTYQIDNVKFNYVPENDKPLTLDKEEVNMQVGETATVKITSGNGNYTIASNDDAIATATEADGTITITGKAEGNADVTVTDTKTKEEKTIKVTVTKADTTLTLDKEEVGMQVGKTAIVKITSGNGNYTVASSDDAIATATEADGTITITGKAEGNADVTVTDTKTKEEKTIKVTVTKEDASLTLDKEEVSMKEGETATVQITSGNGTYTVASGDDAIATATEADGTITITGKAEGNTEITVTDTKTNEVKTIKVTVTKEATPPTDNLLFPGSDFEDWDTFLGALNEHDIHKNATQSNDGQEGSKALYIKGKVPENGYIFTATVPENFSVEGKAKITFYIKGVCAEKSISLNLYKEDGKYYPFNLGKCEADKEINKSKSNSYTGSIDTKGEWVKVTLNIAELEGITTTKGNNLFAFKVGANKKAGGTDWDLLVDNITIE